MKLTVKDEELRKKLQIIQGLNNNKSLNVLDHFIITSNGSNEMMATDMTTSIRENLDATVAEKGTIAVPRKKLFEIVSQLEGEVVIESEKAKVHVTSGNSKFTLACVSPDEYPCFPKVESNLSIVMSADKVVDMLDRTLYGAGEDATRYTLNSVLLHVKPSKSRIRAVGTNGHQMAVAQLPIETDKDDEYKLIIPKGSANRLKSFLSSEKDSPVVMTISEKLDNVSFKANQREMVVRLLEGTFPEYENTVKGHDSNKVGRVKRKDLASALKRMLIVTTASTDPVRFEFNSKKLTLNSTAKDAGFALEEIELPLYKGEDISIKLNPRYLLDALNALEAEYVDIHMKDETSIVVLKELGNAEFMYLIMPMRV